MNKEERSRFIDATIYQMKYGKNFRRIFPGAKVLLVALLWTTGSLFWLLRNCPPSGLWTLEAPSVLSLRDRGLWGRLLVELMEAPDFEWLMIDASHCKVHPHAAEAVGGNEPHKTELNTKIQRMVCWSELLLQKGPELIVKKLLPVN